MKQNFLFCLIIVCLLLTNTVLALEISETTEKVRGFLTVSNNFCLSTESIIRIIFGIECTGDLNFVLTIVLWFVFLMLFFDAIASFTPFSRGASFIIALAPVITLAMFGHFATMARFIMFLITTTKGLTILIASLIIFLIVYVLLRELRLAEKKKIEEMKLEMAKKMTIETGEAISKALKKQS